jgi:flavin-dependent dehydrogenase
MSTRNVEVGVVGAGPAGARAAELLAGAGAETVVIDSKAPWEKPCGGGLTAGTFHEVPEMTELDPVVRRIDAVRLEAPGHSIRIPLDVPLAVVARLELARWQLDRATAAGADLISEKVLGIGRLDDGWRLQLGSGEEIFVRYLVGADGAASRVRRAVRPRFRPKLAPTRVVYPALDGHAPNEALFRFVSGMDGYVWDFPRLDHRSVGAGVSGGDAARHLMDGAVDSYWFEATGATLNGARRGAVIGTAGRPHSYEDVGGGDWALLGDAAGFADPVTGEGIRNALRSAACLVDAYLADGSFAGYPARAEAAFEREFCLSRRIHASLYGGRAVAWFVRAAARSPLLEALLTAVSNGGNEHELRGTVLGRWHSAYREARAA